MLKQKIYPQHKIVVSADSFKAGAFVSNWASPSHKPEQKLGVSSRQIMSLVTEYPGSIQMDQFGVETLKDWSREYHVTPSELEHYERVANFQGSANPLVLSPELAKTTEWNQKS